MSASSTRKSEATAHGEAPPPVRGRWLKRFATWFQPYGILIAVMALLATLVTLWLDLDLRERTLVALEEEKALREATLIAMLVERIELAHTEDSRYAGHVPIFERAARLGIDMRHINVTGIDFRVDGGGYQSQRREPVRLGFQGGQSARSATGQC